MFKEKQRSAWTNVFIRLKEMPHMYDKKHKDYFNRKMRYNGYKLLIQIYSEESGVHIDLPDFKKKLENMRTSFTRELKKVYASKQTGLKDVYEPSLWYFDLLLFLEGTMDFWRTGTDTSNETQDQDKEMSSESEESFSENNQEYDDGEFLSNPTKPPAPKKQKISCIIKEETPMDSAHALMTKKTTEDSDMKSEEWAIIGKSIGLQIRDISKHQQVIVQKIISDAIFYGRLGKLTEESHITLSPEHTIDHYRHLSGLKNTRSHFSMSNQSPQQSQQSSPQLSPQYVIKLSPPS